MINWNPGGRIARGEGGRTYYVPGDISYQEWYNKYVKSQELPKTLPAKNSSLPKALMVNRAANIWIPSNTVIENVHVIAGKGVSVELKAAEALVKKYGGRRDDWQKLVGKVKSDRYEFDVHWYQLGEKTYEHKIKTYKERRSKE